MSKYLGAELALGELEDAAPEPPVVLRDRKLVEPHFPTTPADLAATTKERKVWILNRVNSL